MDPEPRLRSRPGTADRVAAAIGAVVLLLLLVLGYFAAFVNGIRSDPCDGNCAYDVIGAGVLTTLLAPAVVLVAAIVVMILRVRRGRGIGWVPFAGVPVVLLLWVAAFAITDLGLPGGALAP